MHTRRRTPPRQTPSALRADRRRENEGRRPEAGREGATDARDGAAATRAYGRTRKSLSSSLCL